MIEIQVETANGVVRCMCREGETLLEALQRSEIHLPAPCGGVGRCGKCAVVVIDDAAAGPRSPEEDRYAPIGSGRRLACRAVPRGPLTVTIPPDTEVAVGDATAKGGEIHLPAQGIPIVRSLEVEIEPPTLTDQRSVHRRLTDSVGDFPCEVSLAAIGETWRIAKGRPDPTRVAVLVTERPFGSRIIGVDERVREVLPALAIDIGTTTIAVYLVDLAGRRVLSARSETNAQIRFGADVISRIGAAGAGNDLTSMVRRQLTAMTEALCHSVDIATDDVLAASVVGNPTMIHFLFGLDPEPIGRAPFMPLSVEAMEAPMSELGLPAHREARIMSAPGVSGYVGGDIIADVLAAGMGRATSHALLIDIGTNGEMILAEPDGFIACSTAAGPAFEGATIRHGSAAVDGAIASVRRVGDELVFTTIGDVPAKSICGPGLIDTVALLLQDGIVDETGRLDLDCARESAAYGERVTTVDDDDAVLLTAPGSKPIVALTQGDLRQVQLAKGAIAAGVRTLLDHAGIAPYALETVYLAGGFGSYVNPQSALRAGLLPSVPVERVHSVGNAAGAGAAFLLMNRDTAGEAQRIVEESRYIELSRSTAFQDYFMEEMIFPGDANRIAHS